MDLHLRQICTVLPAIMWNCPSVEWCMDPFVNALTYSLCVFRLKLRQVCKPRYLVVLISFISFAYPLFRWAKILVLVKMCFFDVLLPLGNEVLHLVFTIEDLVSQTVDAQNNVWLFCSYHPMVLYCELSLQNLSRPDIFLHDVYFVTHL